MSARVQRRGGDQTRARKIIPVQAVEQSQNDEDQFLFVEVSDGIMAEITVTAMIGNRPARQGETKHQQELRPLVVKVEPETRQILIPKSHAWGGLPPAQVNEHEDLVRAFQLEVSIPGEESLSDRIVVVTQRDEENNYIRLKSYQGTYKPRQVGILSQGRNDQEMEFLSAKRMLVYTANKAVRGQGSNRLDIWIVHATGKIECFQIVVQTLDDGKTFRLFLEPHWVGGAMRLPEPSPYEPIANHDVFEDNGIRNLADQVIFLPGDTFPGFDHKAEVLKIGRFLDFLRQHLDDFEIFEGPERNVDTRIQDTVDLRRPDQGVVKQWDLTRAGGHGIIERRKPDGDFEALEFRYASLDQNGVDFRPDRAPDIKRGDLVTFDETTLDLGLNKDKSAPRPRLVRHVQVIAKSSV